MTAYVPALSPEAWRERVMGLAHYEGCAMCRGRDIRIRTDMNDLEIEIKCLSPGCGYSEVKRYDEPEREEPNL
jgi:hypothetical protein